MKITNYPVDGKYGKYGGRFVPEVLMDAIKELEEAYKIVTDAAQRTR